MNMNILNFINHIIERRNDINQDNIDAWYRWNEGRRAFETSRNQEQGDPTMRTLGEKFREQRHSFDERLRKHMGLQLKPHHQGKISELPIAFDLLTVTRLE